MSASVVAGTDQIPLVVDVDGTLVRTDLLHEASLLFLANHPFESPRLALWLARGKATLKSQLAQRVSPNVERLPLRDETLARIREAQAVERPVYLASASEESYVARLADSIGGITGTFATTPERNLAGAAKADCLVDAFGAKGFDYIGDHPVDVPVWQQSRRQLIVARSGGFETRMRRAFPDAEVIARPRTTPRSMIKTLRAHQWSKNGLLFLALIAGHRFDVATIAATLLGFIAFCAAASSAYIINDLLDIPNDRAHARKRFRPLPAGDLTIVTGIVMSGLLLLLALGIAIMLLPRIFLGALLLYMVATLTYSLLLKRKAIVDVITLAGLYTLRVFAGLFAGGLTSSEWLPMFSLFLFLCLAIEKRCSELVRRREAGEERLEGRNYRVADLAILFPMAAAAGYGSVFVVALYLSSNEVRALYTHPERLWLICPLLLYWISRVLILSNRNEMHDDPIVFALTDRISWYVVVCAMAIVGAAI